MTCPSNIDTAPETSGLPSLRAASATIRRVVEIVGAVEHEVIAGEQRARIVRVEPRARAARRRHAG